LTEARPPHGGPPGIALARWWWLFVLRGAVSIVVGLAAFVWLSIGPAALVLLLAGWMLVAGGLSLAAALRDSEKGREAQLEIDDVQQMIAAQNEYRRRRGAADLTEDDANQMAREDEAIRERARRSHEARLDELEDEYGV
jgi:hypothetical protein